MAGQWQPTFAPEAASPYRHDLTGTGWMLRACRSGAGDDVARAVSRDGTSPAGWLPARVPGLATADLLAAGHIPDPYYADQARHARCIEERDHVYVRRVILRPEDLAHHRRARLVFDSLDTFATVYLNGQRIARHENQFRRLFADVTDTLRAGENWLSVAFEASWPGVIRRAGPPLPHWNPPGERLYVRKSQMSFGWDWAVRVPTVGIAGPVRLELARSLFSGDLWLTGHPVGEAGGVITASAEFLPHETFEAEVALLVDGEERLREHVRFHEGHAQAVTLSDARPVVQRWQPRERGAPHLYGVELRVTRSGHVVDRLCGRVGVRSVGLDLGSAEERRFRIVVNGEPLFVRGENWIPMDLLHTRTTDAALRAYLELLVAGGVNLVRVWGGGIVERESFYAACDELGLLVWQEFPYACGVYPTDEAFLAEARREAEDIVRRLRSHPSLVLWCGNNENEVLAERYAPELREHPISSRVLPEVLERLDPTRPYWPSSPSSLSPGEPADSPREGDRHDWDVWYGWGQDTHSFEGALFCSEFGCQALPQRESLETFLPAEELWTPGQVSAPFGPSPGLLLARHGAQLDKLLARSSDYAYPKDLNTFIAASQALQADTIARAILRARRVGSGGVILWNYTSAWPSVCWAAIDWYRRPKQAFYAARRAFAPLALGIDPLDRAETRFAAYLAVDAPGVLRGTLELSLRHIATGRVVASAAETVELSTPGAPEVSLELPRECPRREHALVARFRAAESGDVNGGSRAPGPAGPPARAELCRDEICRDELCRPELCTVRYLTPLRHVAFGAVASEGPHAPTEEAMQLDGQRRRAVEERDQRVEQAPLIAEWCEGAVRLVSRAWHTRVGLESYEAPVLWDDNYIDLFPGEERTLHLTWGKPEHLWLVANFGKRVRLERGRAVVLA
jgi:beta-mannosidase